MFASGGRLLPNGEALYGALNLRRDAAGRPVIEYWGVNLSHEEPSAIARRAMRLMMQREALAAHGLAPAEADRLETLEPQIVQFDPRSRAEEAQVTLRQRAPFYAALLLSFVLWSVVFSVANMLLTGVIEEKSNKILDTLLTSVTPLEMLIGKLLGVAAVSATLFLFWARSAARCSASPPVRSAPRCSARSPPRSWSRACWPLSASASSPAI